MTSDTIQTLTTNFESFVNKTDEKIEFWFARDLQHLLGYTKWDNFKNVLFKAQTACEVSGHEIEHHFAEVGKTIEMPKGTTKEQIAFAQTYFAIQTRKAELIEQRFVESERVQVRQKLVQTEKELSKVIFEQTGGNNNFAIIRSKGD